MQVKRCGLLDYFDVDFRGIIDSKFEEKRRIPIKIRVICRGLNFPLLAFLVHSWTESVSNATDLAQPDLV